PVDVVDQLIGDEIAPVDLVLDDAPLEHEVRVGGVVGLGVLAPLLHPGLLELPVHDARLQDPNVVSLHTPSGIRLTAMTRCFMLRSSPSRTDPRTGPASG